jgi:hypothetical protein
MISRSGGRSGTGRYDISIRTAAVAAVVAALSACGGGGAGAGGSGGGSGAAGRGGTGGAGGGAVARAGTWQSSSGFQCDWTLQSTN